MRSNGRRVAIACAVIVAGALLLASGLPNLVATFIYAGVYQSLFPATVSWESHGAYVKCAPAIADASQWPAMPAAACQAMHLCANEATLTAGETRALEERMRKSEGCGGCDYARIATLRSVNPMMLRNVWWTYFENTSH